MSHEAIELIPEHELPLARLEFVWEDSTENDSKFQCVYRLRIPLNRYDIRGEEPGEDGSMVRKCATYVELGRTRCSSRGEPFRTPYRDGAHAKWDSLSLGLPVYVVEKGFGRHVHVAPQTDLEWSVKDWKDEAES